ncbi:MAG TPA: hypothetical protein VJ370_04630 [Streptosporangiaceae bacterium]|nr:hypothetical protein [Streptosporangiaceae bacterium]
MHRAHMRNVPSRKRDIADCQWIAELHEHGLLQPSSIPAVEMAVLRARTRYRKRLIEARTAEGQFRVADTYGVQVAPGQDPVVILAVTAVLDTMAHPGR